MKEVFNIQRCRRIPKGLWDEEGDPKTHCFPRPSLMESRTNTERLTNERTNWITNEDRTSLTLSAFLSVKGRQGAEVASCLQ